MALNFDHINELMTDSAGNNIITELNHTFSKAQRGSITTLTDAPTIALNFNDNNHYIVTLEGSRVLGNPTNQIAGQAGFIEIQQDSIGSRILAFESDWRFEEGIVPVISSGPDAISILKYYVRSVNSILVTLITNIEENLFGDSINFSCRFNDGDSAYLSRSFTAGNQKTWTFSSWVKRATIDHSNIMALFSVAGVTFDTGLNITGGGTNDKLRMQFEGGNDATESSIALLRDPSAWYHLVAVLDTTEMTASNRMKMYANGVLLANDAATDPVENADLAINGTAVHAIGREEVTTDQHFDGYLAETIFIDGQALTPTSFGKFNTQGVWVPKNYSGTYGSNGFRLDYADSTNFGNDVSGNNNDFTDNNLTTSDQVSDTPTTNYGVWNFIDTGTGTLSDGNLVLTGASDRSGTFGMSSGKWAWKLTANATAGFGLVQGSLTGTESTYAATSGQVVEFQFNADNGVLQRSVDGGAYSNVATGLTSGPYFTLAKGACSADFGQLGFTLDDATFKYLSTKNLANPLIRDPSKHFQPHIYTGTGAAHSEVLGGNSTFQPDLVWIKNRDQADEHKLVDSVRGSTKELNSDSTNVESTDANGVTAFTSTGFTLGTGAGGYNDNTEKFISWNWKEGVIPGFDIVAYSGTGSAHTESHSLSAVPNMIIVKERTNDVGSWHVYHSSNTAAPETDHLILDTTAATVDLNTIWNDTAPTSSVFSVGTDDDINSATDTYIAYLWAGVEGFSKFGTYEGNGNVDGPFVWCGFRPAYVLCKSIDSTSTWNIFDNKREGFNVDNDSLFADTQAVEGTANLIDLLSNGFKLRVATDPNVAETYIFVAFAETPFKYAKAR